MWPTLDVTAATSREPSSLHFKPAILLLSICMPSHTQVDTWTQVSLIVNQCKQIINGKVNHSALSKTRPGLTNRSCNSAHNSLSKR